MMNGEQLNLPFNEIFHKIATMDDIIWFPIRQTDPTLRCVVMRPQVKDGKHGDEGEALGLLLHVYKTKWTLLNWGDLLHEGCDIHPSVIEATEMRKHQYLAT